MAEDHNGLTVAASANASLAGGWVCDAANLCVRSWDDEFAIYDASGAATHLLSAFAGEVLRVLLNARGPLAAADVTQSLRALDPDADNTEVLHTLMGLAQANLVRRVP